MKKKQQQNKFRFKGLIINHETTQIVDHESMENMVTGLVKEFVIEENRITRESKIKNLVNKIIQKRFDYSFDKSTDLTYCIDFKSFVQSTDQLFIHILKSTDFIVFNEKIEFFCSYLKKVIKNDKLRIIILSSLTQYPLKELMESL
jgi:hypothetical protein